MEDLELSAIKDALNYRSDYNTVKLFSSDGDK
jgi:hypothetical protein